MHPPCPIPCAAAARKPTDQKNVLIMMSNTGGGHKASAEALRQAFQEEFGDEYRVSGHTVAQYISVDCERMHVQNTDM